MREFYQCFQAHTLFFAILGLLILGGIFVFNFAKIRGGKIFVLIFMLISFQSIMKAYPSAKEKSSSNDKIYFLQTDSELIHLYDQGSYVSNNVVHLHYATRLLPDDAPLFLDCIPKTEPFDSVAYSNILSATVATLPEIFEFEFENAISNRWVFYTTYTPGPIAHTNGVAVVEFLRPARCVNVAIPKRTTIWEDGSKVWPSHEERNANE